MRDHLPVAALGQVHRSRTMKLPKGVHERSGRYYLVQRREGKKRWIPLTKVDAGYSALIEAVWTVSSPDAPRTIAELLRLYVTHGTEELQDVTREEYQRRINGSLIPTFGHMPIGALKPAHVARFLETGRIARRAIAANRERAILSSAYEWGMRNGYCELNPCRGVRRNKERPSRQRTTNEQFLAAYARAPQSVRNLMYVAYLTGLRLVDLCRLRWEWVTDEGIELRESKTGHERLIEITDALQLALDRCREYAGGSLFVLVANRGQQWRPWAVQSAWKRLKPGFPFRSIRPMAAAAGDAQGRNVLGHHGQMITRYVRRERLRPVA